MTYSDNNILSMDSLELIVNLGFSEKERTVKQRIFTDIKIYFSSAPIACIDDDADFLCYDNIANNLINLTKNKEFKLIEFMATEFLKSLKNLLRANKINAKIWLRIRKNPPVSYNISFTSYEVSG